MIVPASTLPDDLVPARGDPAPGEARSRAAPERARASVRSIPAWLPWLLGRLASAVATIAAISLIVFAATQALPSDPARVILGPEATEESIAILRHQLGLDQPIAVQFGHWASHAASGDFGRSIDSDAPAGEIVAGRFGNSAALILLTLGLAVPLSLFAGVALAVRRDRRVDRYVMYGLILLKALPAFVVGIGLIILFSTSVLPILPAVSLLDPDRSPFLQPLFLALPAATLVLIVSPFLIRLVRASMIDVLESEFIEAARLRGLPERRVLWRHAVPNALVPAIQGVAMTVRLLLGGALIVEVVFSYPGVGNALNSAIQLRDVPVIQAITLLLTVIVVVTNLLADLLTVLLTPRLRTARNPVLASGARAGLKLKGGGI